jgi:hypothetical protein
VHFLQQSTIADRADVVNENVDVIHKVDDSHCNRVYQSQNNEIFSLHKKIRKRDLMYKKRRTFRKYILIK